jgi:hypothetical protein
MNEKITEYVVYLVVFLLTSLIGAGCNYLLALAKVKLGEAKWDALEGFASDAVRASAQAQKVSGLTNDEAFDMALGVVNDGLDKYNFKLSESTVIAAIEAAVRQMNEWEAEIAE